ncbi:MAG: SigE family RNA polymerase sigma factor [Nakamurella sp.]
MGRRTGVLAVAEQDSSLDGATGPAEFFAASLDRLVRTAFLLTGNRTVAEDLVMTAVAKCLPRWSSIRGEPLPYVRQAVLREFLSTARRRSVVDERPTDRLPERPADDPHERAVLRADLFAALVALPPRQRAVVVLRFFEDLTGAQIAEVLAISVGTVRSQLHDGLAALRTAAPQTLGEYLQISGDEESKP